MGLGLGKELSTLVWAPAIKRLLQLLPQEQRAWVSQAGMSRCQPATNETLREAGTAPA